MRRPICAWAIVLALAAPDSLRAQWRHADASPRFASPSIVASGSLAARATSSARELEPTLLSLVVPGAGQHVLGQRRKWAYVALEAAGWAFWVERRHAGAHYRDLYRDFAWERARIQSSSRVDGDFEYYETLSHWSRSGSFDGDAVAAGVQPELDDTTFNGSVWKRAQGIYLGGATGVPETDPAYQAALAYYGRQAYGPEYLWDWSAAPADQTEFAALVEESDDRYGQATTLMGVVIANHLVSAIDAFVASRVGPAAPSLAFVPPSAWTPWGVALTWPADR